MRGRLLESWLDKANERGYQPVLCQALAERGHTVLHSTRHGPMEFGKDIISRDQAGNVYAFQLKGNPGARLGIGQFNREILPQMYALMQLPVEPPLTEHPVLPRPCLVTNGEVDEEVHAAIRALNGRAKAEKRPELQLITRGQLLGDYLLPVAERMWPTSTEFDACVLRDAEHHAITREMIELRMGPHMAAYETVLGETLNAKQRALLHLALSFFTWRTLVRQSGLKTRAAVEVMVRAIEAVG